MKDIDDHWEKMAGYRELKVSKSYFDIMLLGEKPYDVRKGRRAFVVGDVIKFIENETNRHFTTKVKTVINSWEAPEEWGWDELGDFSIITWGMIQYDFMGQRDMSQIVPNVSEKKCKCIEEIDIMIEYLQNPERFNRERDTHSIAVLELLKLRLEK